MASLELLRQPLRRFGNRLQPAQRRVVSVGVGKEGNLTRHGGSLDLVDRLENVLEVIAVGSAAQIGWASR